LWVCYHDNLKLCASIFTKLGLYVKVVTISSWLDFGHPVPPGSGLQRGENFWLRLTTASMQCLHRLWVLFSSMYCCCCQHNYYWCQIACTQHFMNSMHASTERNTVLSSLLTCAVSCAVETYVEMVLQQVFKHVWLHSIIRCGLCCCLLTFNL